MKNWLAVLLVAVSCPASAQVALFDGVSGLVTIPSVSVGAATYVDVTLRHNGNLTFTLQGATLQTPNLGPGVATYDLATGVLAIPTVLVGCTTYTDVRLANNGSFTFSVQAATEKLAPITAPLAIRTQPANTNVNAGQAASFSVTAAGNAPFGYHWKRNSVDVPGATGASYTTPALTFAENGALSPVVVSNGSGSIASANAMVAILTGPLQPRISAEPVGFAAVSLGSTPTLRAIPVLNAGGGLLGIGATPGSTTLPLPVRDAAGNVFGNVRSISAQYRHALAIRNDSTVWGWGNNVSMNLADGTSVSRAVPVRVQGLAP